MAPGHTFRDLSVSGWLYYPQHGEHFPGRISEGRINVDDLSENNQSRPSERAGAKDAKGWAVVLGD